MVASESSSSVAVSRKPASGVKKEEKIEKGVLSKNNTVGEKATAFAEKLASKAGGIVSSALSGATIIKAKTGSPAPPTQHPP